MNTPKLKFNPCLKSILAGFNHLKQKLAIVLGLAGAALLLPSNASAQCLTATPSSGWQNSVITSQTGTFTATFDATPTASPTNCVIALSNGAQTAYANFACLARFNPTGDIDARNGGAYAAGATIHYSAGVSYHFRLVVNIAAQTYSIFVTPAGGSELTVGSNYAFRISDTTLNWYGVFMDTAASGGAGSATVCNFSTGTTSPSQAGTPTFSPGGGTYSSAQNVTINDSTGGASIRYTVDGSTPSATAGTLYSGPVNISSTKTLKAIAFKTGLTNSAVASATYTITVPATTLTLIPSQGTTNAITLTNNSSATFPSAQLGSSKLSDNLWGLASSSGAVTMTYNPATGVFSNNIALSQMNQTGGVAAYPEIQYGFNPNGQSSSGAGTIFPMGLGAVANMEASGGFMLDLTYTISPVPPPIPMDFAYDIWISPKGAPTGLTSTTIELMIWLYHSNLSPIGGTPRIRGVSLPCQVNGQKQNLLFDVYANASPGPNGVTVSFVLEAPVSAGEVAVDLSKTVSLLGTELQGWYNNSAWTPATLNNFTILDIEFGSEFSASSSHTANYSWVVSNYKFSFPSH